MLKKIVSIVILGFLCLQSALAAEYYSDGEDKDYIPLSKHYHFNQSVDNNDAYRVRYTSYQPSYESEQYVPCHVHTVLPNNLQMIDVKNNIYDRFFHLKEPAQIPAKQVFTGKQLLQPMEISDASLQKYEKKIYPSTKFMYWFDPDCKIYGGYETISNK